jgi:hypothetical protein
MRTDIISDQTERSDMSSHGDAPEMVALDPAILTPAQADESPEVEMCCDGSGKTAEQHRAESADHKCCIDK